MKCKAVCLETPLSQPQHLPGRGVWVGRLQVLLDATVVVDLCGDWDGHRVSVLAAGKLPWPAMEETQRDNLL